MEASGYGSLSVRDINLIMRVFDTNRDSIIDFDEFFAII
jgi:hypothetical protein